MRQATGVSKNVGQPNQPRPRPAQPFKTLLTKHETAGQCLATRQQGVALHLQHARRLPLSRSNSLPHLLPQRRRPPLHRLVTRGLAVGETKFRIRIHQPVRGGEGVHGLRLPHRFRPQPHQVDVRVSGQHRPQAWPGGPHVPINPRQPPAQRTQAIRFVCVHRLVQGAQQLTVTWGRPRQRRLQTESRQRSGRWPLLRAFKHHELDQHRQVVLGRPSLFVPPHQPRAVEAAALR